ncbi:hypothetical protein [Bacillus sp. CDB3]|uniref:hypothetical protein n=1 Tax=Bacillus sp. CDB3 TaxID=360310 RepID=UPI002118855B|nr:hypothetical protein [Bacillus sp. CDB3]
MKLKMYFRSLLEELFREYEKQYPPMYFIFQKVKEQFVCTDINECLLQALHQQREDYIGHTVDTARSIGDEAMKQKLKTIYSLAWTGKNIIFCYFPVENVDIFMIMYLEPQYVNQQVDRVRAHCASFQKNEFQGTFEHLEQFVTFEL